MAHSHTISVPAQCNSLMRSLTSRKSDWFRAAFAARVSKPALRRRLDYDDVVATLEREGIETFVASVDRLLDEIRAKRDVLTAAT